MERFCFFDERKVQFLEAELRVRARLAGKGKGALAARVERHECQRRESILRHDNAARIHADLACSVPVSIVPKASAPTLLKSAVLPPSRAMAARKLAGAPPGCAAMSG